MQTDLARPLRQVIAEDAIQPDAGQQHRHGRKAGGEHADHAVKRAGVAGLIGQRAEILHRHAVVDLSEYFTELRNHRLRRPV